MAELGALYRDYALLLAALAALAFAAGLILRARLSGRRRWMAAAGTGGLQALACWAAILAPAAGPSRWLVALSAAGSAVAAATLAAVARRRLKGGPRLYVTGAAALLAFGAAAAVWRPVPVLVGVGGAMGIAAVRLWRRKPRPDVREAVGSAGAVRWPAVAMAAVAVAGLAVLHFLPRHVTRTLESHADWNAQAVASLMEDQMGETRRAAACVAGAPEVQRMVAAGADADRRAAELILDRHQAVLDGSIICITDAEGVVVASSNRHDAASVVGRSLASRPHFREAAQGRPASDFAVGSVTGVPGYYAGCPVRGPSGNVMGVVVAKWPTTEAEKALARIGEAMVVDPTGVIFAAGRPEWRHAALWPVEPAAAAAMAPRRPSARASFEPLLGAVPSGEGVVCLDAQPYAARRRRLTDDGWSVVVLESLRPIRPVRAAGAAGVLLLGAICLGFFVVLRLIAESRRRIAESRRLYAALVEGAPNGIALFDPSGRCLEANPNGLRLFGSTRDQWVGRHYRRIFACPEDADAFEAIFQAGLAGETASVEHACRLSDGGTLHLSATANGVRDEDGRVTAVVAVAMDIGPRVRAEEALRQSEQRFREIAELLPETVFEVDLEGRLTFVNRMAFEAFGYVQDDFDRGLSAFDMIVPEDHDRVRKNIGRVLAGVKVGTSEYTARRKDGSRLPVTVHSTPIVRDGRPVGVRGILVDISERKAAEVRLQVANQRLEEANRRLKLLASHDDLTGLPNRRRFLEAARQELAGTRRRRSSLSLALFDVDQFKAINDNHGHATGDAVLVEFARVLREVAREADFPCRYGGDEFLLLMPDTSGAAALEAATRLRREMASRTLMEGGAACVRTSVSAGVATLETDDPADIRDLLSRADEALYAAKHAGRDAVRAWEEVIQTAADRDASLEMLRHRLDRLAAHSKEQFVQSIQSLVHALEARDPYTRSHSENVTRYAVAVARELGLDDAEIETVRRAALIHDVGKIGVPDAILRKPGPLEPGEWRVMAEHAVIGTRILQQLRTLDREVLAVRHHHERFDGGGYPDGLAGDAIPLMARVLAVADAFDAITSDRVYRPGRPAPDALRILVEESGRQFDPHVVDAMIEWARRQYRLAGGAELVTEKLLASAE